MPAGHGSLALGKYAPGKSAPQHGLAAAAGSSTQILLRQSQRLGKCLLLT
jgi:hypothetical protein